jgi:glutathione S-transferase
MVLPALIDGDGPVLFQSLAIIEYLDETHPQPPLLPKDPRARARVRGLAQIVAADSHPLIVPRVRHYLTDVLRRVRHCSAPGSGIGSASASKQSRRGSPAIPKAAISAMARARPSPTSVSSPR